MTKREYTKDKFNLIAYCKKKLIADEITHFNGKSIKMCKHKIIIKEYNSHFGTIASEDYNNYVTAKTIKRSDVNFIYVIGNKEHGICKIGFTNNVFKRVKSIQTGCPYPLEIFCVIHGSMETEKKLHYKYKSLRLNGEWFKYENPLKESIENVESVIKDLFIKVK